ncbi:hypothetical protein [Taibaiella koreensis]|uniref:hypothetical protein n=1 Tax=Taibaiella koreensis TaxID=1268548 RepID=UPI000E5A0B0B|nr:hypothetical protein [Taibaiella koreensis]
MSGKKTFVNKSNQYVNVTLLIRQGDNIQKPSLEQTFSLNAGETKTVTYGDNSNIYLNGLVFQWKDATTQSMSTDRQEVIATGTMPTFDAVLNTHSVITINSLKGLDISAGN